MALVYRLVRQKYAATPLDVTGTRLNGGRWNPPGVGILYTAEHPALALLEIMVHMPQVPYPLLPHYELFTLEIPADSLRQLTAASLPAYWNEPTYDRSQYLLRKWLEQPDVLALGVPSAILPDTHNYLLHPAHEAFSRIVIREHKPLVFDERLLK